MSKQEIKDIIRDFTGFNVENDYYQKEKKEELVRQFKKIIYEDDNTVRQFLKAFFESSKKIAGEYSLIANEGEVEEIPTEIDEPLEGEFEPESTEESFMSKVASNILYE